MSRPPRWLSRFLLIAFAGLTVGGIIASMSDGAVSALRHWLKDQLTTLKSVDTRNSRNIPSTIKKPRKGGASNRGIFLAIALGDAKFFFAQFIFYLQ